MGERYWIRVGRIKAREVDGSWLGNWTYGSADEWLLDCEPLSDGRKGANNV